MRLVLLSAAALVAFAAPALAADDAMAGFYGNTLVSTGGAIESHTHLRPDHTFDSVFTGMGQTFNSKGTWELKDGQLCRTYDPPLPGTTNPVCLPGDAHKVGDSWTVTVNGQVRNVSLVAGIQ